MLKRYPPPQPKLVAADVDYKGRLRLTLRSESGEYIQFAGKISDIKLANEYEAIPSADSAFSPVIYRKGAQTITATMNMVLDKEPVTSTRKPK